MDGLRRRSSSLLRVSLQLLESFQATTTSPSDLDQLPGKLATTFYDTYVTHQQNETSWWGVRATEKWVHDKQLGIGGFGVVYLEKEEQTHQLRAVKKISKEGSGFDPKRELSILLALRDHPLFFVQVLGWYENEDSVFLAMEYVEHGNLGSFLKENGPQTEENTKEITTQVLEGLVTLHKRDICYRDLKPENILVASRSPIHIKLADFGISKRTTGTQLKTQCGTERYLAPELKGFFPWQRGTGYTNAVDIWALGLLVYELLTLELPFSKVGSGSDISQISGVATPISTADVGTDYGAFVRFCSRDIDLPTEILQKSLVSDRGIDFVKKLLTADPSSRVSATDALMNEWLLGSPYPPSQEVSRSHDLPKQEIDPKELQRQFRRVGVGISLRNIDILVNHSIKDAGVDAQKLLSSLTVEITEILQRAVSKGYALLLRMLLEFQTISVSVTAQYPTLLQTAAGGGHLDIVKMLLRKGADVNAEPADGGLTALQAAAGGGHFDTVKLLLEKGADVSAGPVQWEGRTALQAAAGGGHFDTVKILLEGGADVNAEPADGGLTALQAAAGRGHLDIVKILLEKGANVNARPARFGGRTALQAATDGGHLDIVKLLEEGAGRNGRMRRYGVAAV